MLEPSIAVECLLIDLQGSEWESRDSFCSPLELHESLPCSSPQRLYIELHTKLELDRLSTNLYRNARLNCLEAS